jgi:hypothetical protein
LRAAADITDKGNEKALVDLQIRPVPDLAKDRAFYSSIESSDNHGKGKAGSRTRVMSLLLDAK